MKSYLVSFMNIEHLRRSLKVLWLDYYRENRVWLTKLGVWVNCEGNRRPSSSFILGTLSVLEPQLTQMLPLVVDLSSNPDRVVMALGLNFNPDEELAAIEQAPPEEVKLLSPFSMALPRLVQPMEAQPIAVQVQAAQVQAAQVQAEQPRKERSPMTQLVSEPVSKTVNQPNSQSVFIREPHEPEPHEPKSQEPKSQEPKSQESELRKPEPRKPESNSFEVGKSYSAPVSQPKSFSQSSAEPLPLVKPALERPKAPSPLLDESAIKQRPPMDTAELAQGQQPDRGTGRTKGDRPAP
jgi:hypothetical protein